MRGARVGDARRGKSGGVRRKISAAIRFSRSNDFARGKIFVEMRGGCALFSFLPRPTSSER